MSICKRNEAKTIVLFSLTNDQKTTLIEQMTKSIDEIGKKDGLEKAIKDFMKNPAMAVPVDMRYNPEEMLNISKF